MFSFHNRLWYLCTKSLKHNPKQHTINVRYHLSFDKVGFYIVLLIVVIDLIKAREYLITQKKISLVYN